MDISDWVKSLSDAGVESPYLDRLRRKLAPKQRPDALAGLQQEILSEMAAALGRSETLLDEALLRCDVAGQRIDELSERAANGEDVGAELARAYDEYADARETAHQRKWELVVHREALGIRRHEPVLSQFYPIPPERRRPG